MKTLRMSLPSLALIAALAGMLATPHARADEGGVSFWLPGQQASLASAPLQPGWTLPLMYVHVSADADAGKEFEIGGRITAGVDARSDILFFAPTFVFKNPVAGGQAGLTFAAGLANTHVGVDATLTGPRGNVISSNESDSDTGLLDLYPTFALRWNHGVHNAMWYFAAGVPVGGYEEGRLVNFSTNHWSADSGGGYTFFNPKSGHEFSVTGGLTYNFENPDTDYQNGIDAHVDLGWSEFVTPKTHIGMVAAIYKQISEDSGSGATLGGFESEVYSVGPQVGHMFPVNGKLGYFNFRAFYEFGAENRLEGWNAMVTVAIPLGRAAK